MRLILLLSVVIFTLPAMEAQQSNDIKQSIVCQVAFDETDQCTLSWSPKVGVDSYRIYQRADLAGVWKLVATGVTDTFYTFSENWESPVEIQINSENGDFATGYILAGNEYFSADEEEQMLLIITHSIFNELSSEIEAYRTVLQNELINSDILLVDESTDVPEIKTDIIDRYNQNPLDYILILGHVAVPYAGNSAIDGHTPDHQGAWVADGYYGEIDGNWTDSFVNNSVANRDANKNIPGDGKFDQTTFPSDVEIAVGRVDFSDLPKLSETEVELTRRYLERNMAYRTGRLKATRRAVIDNNFNLAEGFAQGAIKSFHTFLHPDSIDYGNYSQCTTQDYLFTYGAGAGSYQSASGIISTNALVTDSIQSIFTTIFGSYFGDWDVSNNLLRASLARGSSLINAWSGRPIWQFHYMAMGKSVGDVLLNTQNNNGNYYSQFGKRMCHTSLLGDPSLKMFYHPEVNNLTVDNDRITWDYNSADAEVMGYTVYYKENDEWSLLGEGPIYPMYVDLSDIPVSGSLEVMIRPVGRIQSPSGSYFNEGSGKRIEVIISSTSEPESVFRIFPNPASQYINITGVSPVNEVRIFNVQGILMKTSYGVKDISTSELPPGTYTVMIDNEAVRFIKI